MSTGAFDEIKKLFATTEPARLGPLSRPGSQSEASIDTALDQIFSKAKLPPEKQLLIRAVALLWHDHLDAAHVIAQNIETRDGSFIHAIMHRREPDYGNAKYWFRRVGAHPCFPEIARRAAALLKEKKAGESFQKLVSGGEWSAMAFVDICESAARKPESDPQNVLAREIQRIEFDVLLEYCALE